MKLNGKRTGLKAGDTLEVREGLGPTNLEINLTFEAKRNGKKLEFEGEHPGCTVTDIICPSQMHFIYLLADLTGFEFKRIEGSSREKGSFYLLI